MASAVADEHLVAAETLVAVIPYQAAAFVLVVAVVEQMVAADVAFEVPAALLALPRLVLRLHTHLCRLVAPLYTCRW